MTTIAEIRTQLAAIVTSHVDGWSGSPYIGEQVTTRQIKVGLAPFDPRLVLGGGTRRAVFRMTAYAARAQDVAVAESQLDALSEATGGGSLIEAVEDGDNWDVDVDYAQCVQIGETVITTFGPPPEPPVRPVEYLARPFDVEVVW